MKGPLHQARCQAGSFQSVAAKALAEENSGDCNSKEPAIGWEGEGLPAKNARGPGFGRKATPEALKLLDLI